MSRVVGARGRPTHNLLHQPAVVIMAVAISATGAVPVVWLVGTLVWLSHVVAGRGINIPGTSVSSTPR